MTNAAYLAYLLHCLLALSPAKSRLLHSLDRYLHDFIAHRRDCRTESPKAVYRQHPRERLRQYKTSSASEAPTVFPTSLADSCSVYVALFASSHLKDRRAFAIPFLRDMFSSSPAFWQPILYGRKIYGSCLADVKGNAPRSLLRTQS